MKRTTRFAGVVALATGLLLSACATSANNSGGGASGAPTEEEKTPPKLTNCTNKMKNDAPQVSVWAWYPNMAERRRQLQREPHGRADLLDQRRRRATTSTPSSRRRSRRARVLPTSSCSRPTGCRSFAIQNALVDLTPYGADDVKGNFSDGRLEGRLAGRQGLRHSRRRRPDGHDLPHRRLREVRASPRRPRGTEYAAAAQKVKDAGGPSLRRPRRQRAGLVHGPAAARTAPSPFDYDPAKPEGPDDQAQRPGVQGRPGLLGGPRQRGLVGTQDQFTTDYISGVVGGKYATYVSAAWAPGYLTGAGVRRRARPRVSGRPPRCRSGTRPTRSR